MKILFDPHVHFYKDFSVQNFFKSAYHNFEKNAVDSEAFVLCLTEKDDCNFYLSLRNESKIGEFAITQHANSIVLTTDGKLPLYIFPGRQINSVEGIEVLALFREQALSKKMSLVDLIADINNIRGIPVINWAPGKWLGKRGLLIEEFIKNSHAPLTLGYTSLLPRKFPEPKLISRYKKSHPIIWGSDPLPFKNQELLVGQCGLEMNVALTDKSDSELSRTEFIKSIFDANFKYFGQSSNLWQVAIRLLRNEVARRL